MAITDQMDQIVIDAVKDIVLLGDAGDVDTRINEAQDELESLICNTDAEEDHKVSCIQALASAQIDWGLGERDKILNALVKKARGLGAAARLLDDAAAENVMAKIANTGNVVLTIVNSIKGFADQLAQAVEDPGAVNQEELYEHIETAIKTIESLKKP